MKQQLLFKNAMSKLLVLSCFLLFNLSFGQGRIFYSRATGNWNSNNTWSTSLNASGLGSSAVSAGSVEGTNFPGPDDTVYITGNHIININIANARCAELFVGTNATGTAATTYAGVSTYTGQINFGGAATNGTFNLTIGGNLTVLTSNLATTSTNVINRILNVYKNAQAIVSTLSISGDVVIGNSTNGYIDDVSGTSNIRRLNTINFGTIATGSVNKYGPSIDISGNVNIFSHQVAGQSGLADERYNLSSIRLNSGKMSLLGTDLMEAGSEETSGKGYIKTFRKSHTDPANYSEGRDSDNRFYMQYADAAATLELNHHTDNPFYVTGNIAISKPSISNGIVIYKSSIGSSSIYPIDYGDLIIENINGSSLGVVGTGQAQLSTVKVQKSLSLVSGTLSVTGDSILDLGGSNFTLYMKGGVLTTESASNLFLSTKISIVYSDNATGLGYEYTFAKGVEPGFSDNKIVELILNPGNTGVLFQFVSDDDSFEAEIFRFRRPDYVLINGVFNAATLIELGGNNAVYNGCQFITPRLDIVSNTKLLSNQLIRTTTGNTINSYTSSGVVNLGNTSAAITLTLGAKLNTTNLNMNGAVTLIRDVNSVNGVLNVFGVFKLGVTSSRNLTSNGLLTLKSEEFETARVTKKTTNNGTIIGDVNVERYIANNSSSGPNGSRFWRLLTAPVIKTNLSDDGSIWRHWQNNGEEFELDGIGYGTDIWGTNENYTLETHGMYYLNPGTNSFRKYTTTALSASWSAVSNTKTENLFTDTINNAFLAFIIKPFGQGVTVTEGSPNQSSDRAIRTILSAVGSLRFGDITHTIFKNKYHLFGNPYASPIIMTSIFADNSESIQPKIWLMDSQLGSFGGYVTFDGSDWSDTGSLHHQRSMTTIQSGEAFFIKTSNTISTSTTDFYLNENHKDESPFTSSAAIFGRAYLNSNSSNNSKIRLLLKKVENSFVTHEDGSTVKFYSGGSNEVDDFDSEKFSNPNATISFINGTTKLAIEHRATVVAGDEVFVNVSNATANTNYKLHIYTENFTFSGIATLHDLKLGTTTVMPIDGSVFEYPFTVTSDATTQGTRFKIVFSNSALSVDDVVTNSIRLYPNPVSKSGSLNINLGALENMVYNYRIVNMLGQTIQTGKLDKTDLNQEFSLTFNTAFSAGLYTIEVLDQNKVIGTSKIIIK